MKAGPYRRVKRVVVDHEYDGASPHETTVRLEVYGLDPHEAATLRDACLEQALVAVNCATAATKPEVQTIFVDRMEGDRWVTHIYRTGQELPASVWRVSDRSAP